VVEASSSSSQFRGTTPFKVQVNFVIPIFEGQIYTNVLNKWLNLLEGYFSIHNFSDRENITLVLLKPLHMSRTGGKLTVSKGTRRNPHYFQPHPLRILFDM